MIILDLTFNRNYSGYGCVLDLSTPHVDIGKKYILDIEKDFQNKKLNRSNFSLFVQLFHIF